MAELLSSQHREDNLIMRSSVHKRKGNTGWIHSSSMEETWSFNTLIFANSMTVKKIWAILGNISFHIFHSREITFSL